MDMKKECLFVLVPIIILLIAIIFIANFSKQIEVKIVGANEIIIQGKKIEIDNKAPVLIRVKKGLTTSIEIVSGEKTDKKLEDEKRRKEFEKRF